MRSSTISLTSSTPADLRAQISNLSLVEQSQYKCIALSISGEAVLVQPFKMSDIKIKDIKMRLQLVSVELLNLPADQIAFDYQILSSDDQHVCGVFTCAPKALINEYMSVIQESGFSATRITAYILTSIDAFYQDNPAVSQRFCLLDFSSDGYINLAVLHELRFELLRKVPYDNFSEALFEIKQSLRSACAKSSVKHFDNIYFSGDIPEKERIINEIQNTFETKSLYKDAHDVKQAQIAANPLFSINLIADLVVSGREHKYMLHAMHGVIALAVLGCFMGMSKINKIDQSIQDINNKVNQSTYSYSSFIKQNKV